MIKNFCLSELGNLLNMAAKLKFLNFWAKTDRYRSKSLRRFSTVLMVTIITLVTVSALVVLTILNRYLGERVEEEFQKKLSAQKGQVEILIRNRITEIKKVLEDFSSDNTIRVTMMLDAKSKLTERITQSYPSKSGVYPLIQLKGSWSIFPEKYSGLAKESILYAFYTHPRGDIFQDGSKPRLLWLFSRSIMGTKGNMGTAAVLYDMTEDTLLKESIQMAVEGDMALSHLKNLHSLTKNLNLTLDPKQLETVEEKNGPFIFLEDLVFSRILDNRHLYFVFPSKGLQTERRKVTLLMSLISALILGVSLLISAFLAGKMVRPLKEMTRKAIQISEGTDTPLKFNKDGSYWEFNQLSQAFNTMLSNLKDAEERSRYQELLENVDDSVTIFDEHGAIIDANTAAYTSLGYSRDQFYNLSLYKIIPSKDAQTIIKQLGTPSDESSSKKLVIETFHRGNNGFSIPVEIYSHPITYVGKSVILNVARDITKRIEAEKEKKQLETQLNHAQKMEAMGTMAGCIAHDFNNLIMGIQGRLDILRLQHLPDQPGYKHIEAINKTVKSATVLTRQLLGFARREQNQVVPVNLNTLVEESTSMFIRSRKEITLQLQFEEKIWPIKVDRGQLEQVLVNLYVNAWQAMPKGGNLNIRTENVFLEDSFCKPFEIPGGEYVNIRISDTGVGMSKEIMNKIFDPFFTTKEAGKGTGLGLASAYGIIRNHKGIILVESEVGKGTIFNIYLPSSLSENAKRFKGRGAG